MRAVIPPHDATRAEVYGRLVIAYFLQGRYYNCTDSLVDYRKFKGFVFFFVYSDFLKYDCFI